MSTTLEQLGYHYSFASAVDDHGIQLAACDQLRTSATSADKVHAGPFLRSQLVYPRQTARMLRALSRVVRTHYFDARPPQLDPIVTTSPSVVRFEGFSGCCGVYVRLDIDREALQTQEMRWGTTNVDFNGEMIQHLDRIGRDTNVSLDISHEGISVEHSGAQVFEKKVTLPKRWIKGLCEVQVYQTRLELVHRFSPGLLMPLLQQAGGGTARSGAGRSRGQLNYLLVQAGRPRLSPRMSPGAIPVGGLNRLDSLRSILPLIREVQLYSDPESGVHAWMAESESLRYWLVVSPELYRGFSGEGQVLSALANGAWEDRVDDLEDWLAGETTGRAGQPPKETIDPAEIASALGWSVADANIALAGLATSGLAGFDLANGFYFQRRLPMNPQVVETDQPRLRGARKLVDENAVRRINLAASEVRDSIAMEVRSGEIAYFVRLGSEADSCTCPWFSRHQGERGPCKHVLAARIVAQGKHQK
ncbi:SWIM zinc finger family protein [Bremerella sp. JC817]|uniref:SWIM zinc finger family protein n=1 Tax=Bremerella sp. JC817 TaxID=3231756 RepID=UPI003457CCFE